MARSAHRKLAAATKRPKLSTEGMLPAIWVTRDSSRIVERLWLDMDKRIKRAQELAIVEIAGRFLDRLQSIAPDIGDDYPDGLELAVVEGAQGYTASCCVYFPNKVSSVSNARRDVVVIVVPTAEAGEVVAALAKGNPWPQELLPFQPDEREARLVSRSVTFEEADTAREKLHRASGKIEAGLAAAGLPGVKIAVGGSRGTDLRATDDIGFTVLRHETGIIAGAKPHWMVAVKGFYDELPEVEAMVMRYMDTGKESEFRDRTGGKVENVSLVKSGKRFGATIVSRAGV